jgi:tetratricopeptide (TPR) repeat protein
VICALLIGFSLSAASARPSTAVPVQTPAQAAMAQGQQLFAQARFDEALTCFQAAARQTPQDPSIWNMIGLCHHAQKDWNDAAPAFEKARALLPNDPRILDNLGVCRFELHDYAQAAPVFRAAVSAEPTDSRAHLFLGRIALAQGDETAAEHELELAVTSPAPDPVAALHQGLFFLGKRRLEDARKSFETALRLDPDQAGAHLNLGLVLQRQGRTEESKAHLRRFRELTEITVGEERMRLRVTAHLRNANTELEAARLDAALWSALHARDEAPELPIVHQLLARIYAQMGRAQDSESEMARVKELMEKAQPR